LVRRKPAEPARWDDDATIVQSIALIVLLSLLLLAAVALWSSWRANDLAVARETRLAANALATVTENTRRRLADLAANSATYQAVHLRPTAAGVEDLLGRLAGRDRPAADRPESDQPGSDRRIGDATTAVFVGTDGAAVIRSDGNRLSGDDAQPILRDVLPLLDEMRRAAYVRPPHPSLRTEPPAADTDRIAWTRVAGRPVLLAAAVVRPPGDGLRRPGPASVVAVVTPIGPTLLDEVGHTFVLPELGFTAAGRSGLPPLGPARLEVFDDDGDILGALTWTSAMPGQWMLRNLMPQTLTAAGFVVVFAGFVVRRFRRRVEEMKASAAAAKHAALHDGLSGLPNRILFGQRLDEALAVTRRDPAREFAVVYIDLDRFKDINDTLGHQAGDEVIRRVAERLAAAAGPGDTAARLAGDEFALILTDIGARRALDSRLADLVTAIGEPVAFGERTIYPGGSLGAAVAPHDGSDRIELQHRADLALYRAKAAGRGRWLVFSDDMDDGHRRRQTLRQDLRSAIADNRLSMLYQPVMRADTLTVAAVEARVAWDHPSRGRITAGEFIPIAEESGMIRELGHWVLRRACADAQSLPDLTLVVNISPSEMRHPSFAEDLLGALAAADFDPHRLQVDLTENVLLRDADIAIAVIERLRAAGIRIALDEFGSGQSSFNYLQKFRFDLLKIDRAVIARVESSNEIATIVHATVDLARRLGIATSAEGIETFGQLRFVQALGCDTLQGHLFARPMPFVDVTAFITRPNAERLRSVA
jgi:diguanylate cyclase (GGDEF)-like protein